MNIPSGIVPESFAKEKRKRELEAQYAELFADQLAAAGAKERKQIQREIERLVKEKIREEFIGLSGELPWVR
jgi:DNA topoisomerase VI subunit B